MSGVQPKAARTPSVHPEQGMASRSLVSIGCPASGAMLEPTYTYLSMYAFTAFSARVAERLNVAMYELLSNALHYGSSEGEVRLELSRSESGRGAVLSVSNYVESDLVERLVSQMSRVLADPAAAFASEMERFSRETEPRPMIGLVRVAHESALRLELRREGSRVEISTQVEP